MQRPLAIYLHHDASIAANVFATVVMCNEEIVALLAQAIVWPWDMTSPTNANSALRQMAALWGDDVIHTLASISTERYPMLIMFSRAHTQRPRLIGRVDGQMGQADAVITIQAAFAEHDDILEGERREEVGGRRRWYNLAHHFSNNVSRARLSGNNKRPITRTHWPPTNKCGMSVNVNRLRQSSGNVPRSSVQTPRRPRERLRLQACRAQMTMTRVRRPYGYGYQTGNYLSTVLHNIIYCVMCLH